MRKIPFVLVPSSSGMRQPIHAIQLAEVVFYLMRKTYYKTKPISEIISLGGDEIFDYVQMIENLQDSLVKNDKAKKCLIVKIPNRLFLIGIVPIIIFSPKTFSALSRMCSNLSGFKKACEITKTKPIIFPYSKDLK